MIRVDLRSWEILKPGDSDYENLAQDFAVKRNHIARNKRNPKRVTVLSIIYQVIEEVPGTGYVTISERKTEV